MSGSFGQLVQMIAAIVFAIGFFVLAYSAPEKRVLAILIVLIPIQLIDSKFGTLNVFLTYLIAAAFVLQGRLKAAPLLWSVFLLLLAYAISFSFSHPAARTWHVLYMIGFVSNILLFYLVYNYIDRTGDWKLIFRSLIGINVLVVIACLIEVALGDNQIQLFGIRDWTLGSKRAYQGRIEGPFASTHTTADYLVAQCMLLGFWLAKRASPYPRLIGLLLALNFLCLVATGDRGGFVGLTIGGVIFLYLFRRDIGGARVAKFSILGVVLLAVTSFAVVEYTQFGRLYERLAATEFEGEARPRTIGFNRGVRWFLEKPIIGRGPRLNVSTKARQIEGIPYIGAHPHNLPLTILVTTGVVGMLAWLIFFISALIPMFRSLRLEPPDDPALSGMPRLGLLVIFLFLLGEMRIEFLRVDYQDYQHYIFVLLGLFVACSDLLRKLSFDPQPTGPLGAKWHSETLAKQYQRVKPATDWRA